MKTIICFIFLMIAFTMSADVYAQPGSIRETNTPVALHYASILNEYIAFIKPNLNAKNDLIKLSKEYFGKLRYRIVTISITTTIPPKFHQSWKIPHSKMAVLPRMVCYINNNDATISLYDQGDDYVLIQNYTDQTSNDQALFISVGLTHQWK
ncbi:MAG: hypothetical protein H6R39_232 [Deltaproteobacteria bacterium]|nr:hypothetical protein [Deltaproteobacteria bacterium]